jgi:hypothetical protein
MERLGDDDAGSDLQDPVIDDDHAFGVDRLGQEPLPQVPGLLRPGRVPPVVDIAASLARG